MAARLKITRRDFLDGFALSDAADRAVDEQLGAI
jgi:hypothetical protein